MKTIKIAFFDAKPYDIEFFNKANLEHHFEINYIQSHLNPMTAKLAQGHDAVCAFVNDIVSEEVISSLHENDVKLIALRSAGYNNVDLKAALGKLSVVRVPAYSPYAVAEHTVALLLTLNRKIHKAHNRTRESNFNIDGLMGVDLHGKKIGIIGTGKIGQLVIKIAVGFGMEVLAYDVFPNKSLEESLHFSYVSLDTLYRDADIISLNCPLTAETHHLINEESISKMKEGIIIINTGRGKLIDTKALIQGLKHKKIAGAGLDVYEEEGDYFFEDFSNKILPDDNLVRLLSFNNVILTSHQAFFTKEAMTQIAQVTLQNVDDFFSGKENVNAITI
ncbi:MAG: 2-hydroxyacid dehydrogenase [Bacteriovorax sp.]